MGIADSPVDRSSRAAACSARSMTRLVLALLLVLASACASMLADPLRQPPPPFVPDPDALAAAEEALLVGDGVEAPEVIYDFDPRFPDDALREGVRGVVILSVVVLTNGRVEPIEVKRSPDPRLTAAAVEAIRLWHYKPGRLDGVPVPVLTEASFRFDSY